MEEKGPTYKCKEGVPQMGYTGRPAAMFSTGTKPKLAHTMMGGHPAWLIVPIPL